MSKKKNTLKDLDEFLKQQAAALVSPPKLGEDKAKPSNVVEEKLTAVLEQTELTIEDITYGLQQLASKQDPQFKKTFYDLIIKTLEAQGANSAEDKVLINTALYLKHGTRWKEMIRAYWKNK